MQLKVAPQYVGMVLFGCDERASAQLVAESHWYLTTGLATTPVAHFQLLLEFRDRNCYSNSEIAISETTTD